jgi:hypothetical protein
LIGASQYWSGWERFQRGLHRQNERLEHHRSEQSQHLHGWKGRRPLSAFGSGGARKSVPADNSQLAEMDQPRCFQRKQLGFGGTRQSPVVCGSGRRDLMWCICFVGSECTCSAGRHDTADWTDVGHSLVPSYNLSDWNGGAFCLVTNRISHRALLDCARHAVVSHVRGTKWTTSGC